MKIEKAIELLNCFVHGPGAFKVSDNIDAINLSIEALKQIQQLRAYAKSLYLPLLPGETED